MSAITAAPGTGTKFRERLPVLPESGGGVGNLNLFETGSLELDVEQASKIGVEDSREDRQAGFSCFSAFRHTHCSKFRERLPPSSKNTETQQQGSFPLAAQSQ